MCISNRKGGFIIKLSIKGSGSWIVGQKEYLGHVYTNEEYGVIELEFEIVHHGKPLSFLELPLTIEYISGEYSNGAKATFINCRRNSTNDIYNVSTKFSYSVEFLLNGVSLDSSTAFFESISFEIQGLNSWGGISAYKNNGDDNFALVHNDEVSRVIYSSNQFELSYHIQASPLPYFDWELLKHKIELNQRTIISIESKETKDIYWFMKQLNVLKRLIEISFGKQLFIHSINGYLPDKIIKYAIEFKSPRIQSKEVHLPLKQEYLFTLNELVELGRYDLYFQKYEKLEPIIDLYIELLYSENISLTRFFLNIVQALETYHSSFVCNGSTRDFRKRVQDVYLNKLLDQSEKDYYKKLLLAKSNSFITLESRLADLILSEFGTQFELLEWTDSIFPNIISSTRNYYTHLNPLQKKDALSGEKLHFASVILKSILEYYILKEVGFSDVTFRTEKIKEQIEELMTHLKVKEAVNTLQSRQNNHL